MKKPIKKIIAREGLILLGIVTMALLFMFVLANIPDSKGIVWDNYHDNMIMVGFAFLYLGYPLYLLIRFILWAIRTLREK